MTSSSTSFGRPSSMGGSKGGAPMVPASLRPSPRKTTLDLALLELGFELLDLGLDRAQVRVDLERALEGAHRRLLVAERGVDLAQAGERAPVARLELEGLLDIDHRGPEVADQELDGGALVPALGELRVDPDHCVGRGQRALELARVHCVDALEHQE